MLLKYYLAQLIWRWLFTYYSIVNYFNLPYPSGIDLRGIVWLIWVILLPGLLLMVDQLKVMRLFEGRGIVNCNVCSPHLIRVKIIVESKVLVAIRVAVS